MGEAKRRGTFEERRQQAIETKLMLAKIQGRRVGLSTKSISLQIAALLAMLNAEERSMNAIIYDTEIINAVPMRDEPRAEGIIYCEGWRDHANMGVSVIGCYDYAEDRYRVFCADNQHEFAQLILSRDLCVGFSIPFDNAVLRASKWPAPADNCSYDILREVWAGAGLGPAFQYPSHAGYGLDEMCRVNFGTRKSGNGALAPVLWQRGQIGEVIDYCLNDVRLTKQLFDKILATGQLMSPKGGMLTIRQP